MKLQFFRLAEKEPHFEKTGTMFEEDGKVVFVKEGETTPIPDDLFASIYGEFMYEHNAPDFFPAISYKENPKEYLELILERWGRCTYAFARKVSD